MTVIAYRDRVLVGDGLVSDDDGHVWATQCVKVHKLADGSLIGTSGDSESAHRVRLAAEAAAANGNALAMDFPHLSDEASVIAIMVTPDGKIWLTEGAVWEQWTENFMAIGNGKRIAMAVMRLGHSALEAVKAGIDGDIFCGGLITSVSLDPPTQ